MTAFEEPVADSGRLAVQRLRAAERLAIEQMPAAAREVACEAADVFATLVADVDPDVAERLDAALGVARVSLEGDVHDGLRALRRVASIAEERDRGRLSTLVAELLVALSLVALILSVWRVFSASPQYVDVRASGWWIDTPAYRPVSAVDGVRTTHWYGREFAPSWVEIELSRAQPVRAVRLVNAPSMDAFGTLSHSMGASRSGVVELFDDGRPVASATANFDEAVDVDCTVAVASPRVTRVRVSIDTWQGMAVGLTEIVVE
jgi:hypothetical protein